MKCPGLDKHTGKPCRFRRGHTRAMSCLSVEPRFAPGRCRSRFNGLRCDATVGHAYFHHACNGTPDPTTWTNRRTA